MCGRFALATEKHILEMLYQLEIREDLEPRFNITPGQKILAVRFLAQGGSKEPAYFKWGLVPFWADDPASFKKLINARSETAAEKPSFRNSFKKRRLLIPAAGFYEWKKVNGASQPYYICRKDGSPFSFGGLWERWDKGPEPFESCAILTTGPNLLISPIHNRMPLIISAKDYDLWLDPNSDFSALSAVMKPYPPEEMQLYPVSRRVNSPVNDSADLIGPISGI